MNVVAHRSSLTLAAMGAASALFLGSVAVHAQDASSYDGKWAVKWLSTRGNPTEATLELNGSSGNFRQWQRGKYHPCAGIEVPVSARKSGDELLVTVKYSEVVKGCSNSTIKLKKVGDRALEGVFGSGKQVSAVKE